MKYDQNFLSDILQQWKATRTLCSHGHRTYMVNGTVINETRPSESYNLPFVLAYAVLDQVLAELISQGTFQCAGKNPPLGIKMEASQNAIPWQDYNHIKNGKEARNFLAHEARLLNKDKCLEYVDAIETELRAWGVL